MDTLFSWIHLADLQFAAAAGPRDRLLGRLRDDLAEHRELRAPDLLVVTGDVAATGAPAEYARAGTWLREAGSAVGLGPARIFVIPGNHDVDRTPEKGKAYGNLRQELVQGTKSLDAALAKENERNLLVRKLQSYLDFAAGFAPACLTATGSAAMLDWSHRVQGKGGMAVRLVGLDSVLLSAGDADRGVLRLGSTQLERALASIIRGEMVMVLSHHPVEGGWLADEAEVKGWLGRHAQLFLSSQIHDDGAEEARKGKGAGPIWVTSGATAQGKGTRGARRFAYSFGAVVRGDDGALRVRIWPRSWAADRRTFGISARLLPSDQSHIDHPFAFTLQPDLVVSEAAWRAMGRSASVHHSRAQRAIGDLGSAPPPAMTPAGSSPPPPRHPSLPALEIPAWPPAARSPSDLPPAQPAPAKPAVAQPASAPPRRPPSLPALEMPAWPPAARSPSDLPPAQPAPAKPAAAQPPSAPPARHPSLPALEVPVRAPAARAPSDLPPAQPAPVEPSVAQPVTAQATVAQAATVAPPVAAPSVVPPSSSLLPSLPIEVDPSLFEGPGGLPAHPIHYFVGRTLEMATLREGLTRDPSVTCVVATGLGGVGKTSLVHHFVATEAKEIFEEAAWIDARDLWNDLGRVARRYGWKDGDRAPTVEEATRHLTTALFDRQVLLVIDNVDLGVTDVRKIPIPGGRCRTVITSRSFTLHEDLSRPARPVRLGCWDLATCRAHLRQVVPWLADTPDADLDQISRKVGGLPLAMRLIAKLLLRPDASVARLLARMDKEPLGTLDAAAKGSDRSVAATFLTSVRSLDETQRRVLTALSATAPSTRTAVVAAVVGLDEDTVSGALEELADQSLIDWVPSADRPFRLHDVVGLLLRSQPGVTQAEAAHTAFVARIIEENRDPGSWEALDRDMPEVLTAVERALRQGAARTAFRMLCSVADHQERRGRVADLIERFTRMLEAFPDTCEERAGILTSLGHAYAVLGDLHKAVDHFQHAQVMAEQGGFAEGQAGAFIGLGHCYSLLGDTSKSIACAQRAREIYQAVGDREREASALTHIGIAYRKYGELSRAIEYLEQAQSIQEELGLLEGQAATLGGLGLCLRDVGEIEGALDSFKQALSLEEMLGHRRGQASTLGNIGNTYRAADDVTKAIQYLSRSLALFEELNLLDGQAAALGNLGSCYRTAGDYAAAIDHLQRALTLQRQVGLPADHPVIRRLRSLLSRCDPLGLDEVPRTSAL
ncbi:MAG: tetratricopeptide repeat protein [Byssovorax sp.]